MKMVSAGRGGPNHCKAFPLTHNACIIQPASIKRKLREIYRPGLTVW